MHRHLRHQYFLSAVVLFSVLVASIPALAGKKPSEADIRREQQQKKLTKTLQAESLGVTTDRAEKFKALIADGTDLDQAYWQAGYVKYYDRWIPLGEPLFNTSEKEQREEYVNYRKQFWGNDEENLKIAQWCAQHNLADQARAHLMAILLNQPDNAKLRSILGYQRIAGQWMNQAEYRAAAKAAEQFAANRKTWEPVVISIRNGLVNPNPVEQNAALKRLHAIDDVDAVAALASILLPASEQSALACVGQLCEIEHRNATLALCHAAMFTNWPRVKDAATNAVKVRRKEDYVPTLLSSTQSEYEVSATISINPRQVGPTTVTAESRYGRVGHVIGTPWSIGTLKLIARNETMLTNQLLAYDFSSNVSAVVLQGFGLRQALGARVAGELQCDKILALDWGALNLIDETRHGLDRIDQRNQQIRDLNNKVISLLNTTADLPTGSSLPDAWLWWNASQDIDIRKQNRINEVFEQKTSGEFIVGILILQR